MCFIICKVPNLFFSQVGTSWSCNSWPMLQGGGARGVWSVLDGRGQPKVCCGFVFFLNKTHNNRSGEKASLSKTAAATAASVQIFFWSSLQQLFPVFFSPDDRPYANHLLLCDTNRSRNFSRIELRSADRRDFTLEMFHLPLRRLQEFW